MRWLLLVLAIGCAPPGPTPVYVSRQAPIPEHAAAQEFDPMAASTVIDRMSDFAFDGGRIEFEMRRSGTSIFEVARNHYAVPIVMQWELVDLTNLQPTSPVSGVALLPAAGTPNGDGETVLLATLVIADRTQAYHRNLQFHARFGDPNATPTPYAYRLPYSGTHAVLQGFHGNFSHRGSNEYAVDFDCPVATHVLATRPGMVVATNAAAQGSGTTPEYLEYKRTNFVIIRHEDGTLGEYMHLSPSGVLVRPGQMVKRGDELALSGNTGFSSVPHLHFQVMTAGDDGVTARSFPFELQVTKRRIEAPVQGRSYAAWE